MTEPKPLFVGHVEPNVHLLQQPPAGQLVYKVMSTENFFRCLAGSYLYFNRVDSYKDFTGADAHDGAQLPSDVLGNTTAGFLKAPDFTASDYYNQARQRTYACCFSTENSKYIWENYGNGGTQGKVCIVFDFDSLRSVLNATIQQAIDNDLLEYNGLRCHQIFSINHGLVEYIDRDTHQGNHEHLPNPIRYTYWKDERFSEEKELRVSLSALGIGRFAMKDGSFMDFPEAFQLHFDFRSAIATSVSKELILSTDCDQAMIDAELVKANIHS
jgi:hypothetical protein